MKKEVWKPIAGYEGWYEVSNLGRVRSLDRPIKCLAMGTMVDGLKRGRILSVFQPKSNENYMQVVLCKNGVRKNVSVNTLIKEAFAQNSSEPSTLQCSQQCVNT